MNFIFILLLAGLLAWFVYRKTYSTLWAIIAGIIGIIVMPIVVDQLWSLASDIVTPLSPSNSANGGTATSACNCA